MSRIGKRPVVVPAGISVEWERPVLTVTGPKGTLTRRMPPRIALEVADSDVRVTCQDASRESRAQHGLARALVANMVTGVIRGYQRVLEITGVGYRAEMKGQTLVLTVGHSHPILFPLPRGVVAEVDRLTTITLSGADKEVVGQTAAEIRAFRPPEPYKGKGIRYRDEVIRRKVGKAVTK